MQKMFNGKFVAIVEVQPIAKTQTIHVDMNVVDVNVTIRYKITKKQVFKDRKLRKAKNAIDQEKKEWLKKSTVQTIQQIQKTQT